MACCPYNCLLAFFLPSGLLDSFPKQGLSTLFNAWAPCVVGVDVFSSLELREGDYSNRVVVIILAAYPNDLSFATLLNSSKMSTVC